MRSLDFTRLLGFDSVADQLSDGVDFHDMTFGAKLGAKVGTEPLGEPNASSTLDFSKLLGFEAVAEHLSNGVDFKDETLGAKLGAKVGQEATGTRVS